MLAFTPFVLGAVRATMHRDCRRSPRGVAVVTIARFVVEFKRIFFAHTAMTSALQDPASSPTPCATETAATRRRARPGQRRDEILQALAAMLESPHGDRITTAALAARLGLSEAALYRYFSGKSQMFEALVEFIEQSLQALEQQITHGDAVALAQTHPQEAAQSAMRIVAVVLQFGQRNPGLARVMTGEALLLELPAVQAAALWARVALVFDRLEATLRQCLRTGGAQHDSAVAASVLMSFLMGRLQRFVRTGFRRDPTEHLQASLDMLL